MEKGITYAPDFVINAGGLINCYSEVIGYNRDDALAWVENIYNSVRDLLKKSKEENVSVYLIAKRIAIKRIEKIKNLRPV